jgi:predicted membrane protein
MNSRIIFGTIVILVGVGFLFDFNILRFLIPVFLIFIGLQILTGRSQPWNPSETTSREDVLERVAVFSGIKQRVTSENFKKAEIVAVFGSGEIDFSETKSKSKTIELDLVAVFGGVKVRIPQNWYVSSEGVGILGGFSDNTAAGGKDVKCLVKGVALFGGVEIVN